MVNYFFFFLIIFFINFLLFYNTEIIAKKLNIFDKPSKIKHQKIKVPSIGGLYLFINLILAILYFSFIDFRIFADTYFIYDLKQLLIFLILLISIFLIGLYDDKYNLYANTKLVFLIPLLFLIVYVDEGLKVDTLSFTFNSFELTLNRTSTIFSVLCLLAYLNCINMFDGINLQTSLNVILILLIFQISINRFDPLLFTIILFLLHFSYYNYKSKIFLGDSGTLVLAFLLGYILIKSHNILFIKSDIIFSFTIFPVMDMIRLTFKRIIKGKHPFVGDNDHIHHRLMRKKNLRFAILTTFISIGIPLVINVITEYKYSIYLITLSFIFYIFIIIFTSDKKNNLSIFKQ